MLLDFFQIFPVKESEGEEKSLQHPPFIKRSRGVAQLLATVQRSIQRLSISYFFSVKWLRTGWRLVQRWRVIIGVLSLAALLPKSHRSRGASICAIPSFGRGGLVIADNGKNLCYNAFMQSR